MGATESSRDILIQSERPEEARRFYEQVLGLTVFQDAPQMIGLEGGALRLFIDSGPAFGPVLEFLVEDFEAMKAALLAAGCTIEQDDPSVPRCYFRDPFGLIFNLGRR